MRELRSLRGPAFAVTLPTPGAVRMEIGVVLDCSPQFDCEAQYVFNTLLDTLGASYTLYPADTPSRRVERPACDVIFHYGRDDDPRRPGDGFLVRMLCEDYHTVWSGADPPLNLTTVSGARRGMPSGPILFAGCAPPRSKGRAILIDASDEKPLVTLSEQSFRIDILFDLVASAFHVLSGDVGRRFESSDAFSGGQFATASGISHPLYQSDLLDEPIVNNYMEILLNLLIIVAERRETALLQKWYWPRSNEFALFLSHDVEFVPKRSLREDLAGAAKEMLRLRPRNALAHMSSALRLSRTRREPLRGFSELVRLETEHSFSSSFYFSAVGAGSGLRDVSNERMTAALDELRRSGFEVGLSVSEEAPLSGTKLRAEKELLEEILRSEVSGLNKRTVSPHNAESYLSQERAAFTYGSAGGLSDIGYRTGLAFPYFPYIRSKRRASSVLQIPAIVADQRLFEEDPDTRVALARVANIVKKTSRYHALFGLLWHTYVRDANGCVDRLGAYRNVLKRFDGKWVFNDTGAKLAKWWFERKAARLGRFTRLESGFGWTISAPDGITHLTLKLYPGFDDYEIDVSGATYFLSRAESVATMQLQTIEPGKEVTIAVTRR
jgi:hypothetical protein